MPGQLLSQRDIAKHIGKAFSTVSGYVDQFPEFFSHNGEEGLTRRYYPQSLVVAEAISDLKSQRLPVEEIRELLNQRFRPTVAGHLIERPESPIERLIERSMSDASECLLVETALPLAGELQPVDCSSVGTEQSLELASADATLCSDLPPAGADDGPIERPIEHSIECSMDDCLDQSSEDIALADRTPLATPSSADEPAAEPQAEIAPPSTVEDTRLTELSQSVARQQRQIASLEERLQSLLEIQAALVRERDQYHADLAADLLERDKLMVKWVRDLHSQPSTPGGWLRKLLLLSPFGRPKA